MTRSLTRLRRTPIHQRHLGILSVEDGGDGGGGGASGGDANQGAGSDTENGGSSGGGQQNRGSGSDADKPISEMTDAEKAAYFERKSNRMRDALRARGDYDDIKAERDQLKQANETASEKAIREAREQAKSEGRAEALRESQSTTVKALLEGALRARNVTDDDVETIVDDANLASFVKDGEINHDKIVAYAQRNSGGSKGGGPDFGQGSRGNQQQPKPGELGRAQVAKRYPQTATTK